ncbi:MAG: extracellular solute-binding protein, partial [Sandaracinaceae bacterium]|nr:extracellular solute-binding protein [Sandaracinaceae bacterium]
MSAAPRALVLAALSCAIGAIAVLGGSRAGRAQESGVSIFLWHAYGESEARGLEAAVDAFEAREQAEGRDVHVEVTAIPFGAYASKLQAAIPVGNGPDVFVDAHDRIASYVDEELVRDFGALDPAVAADVEPAHLDALRDAGSLAGVPLSAKSLVLFVNTELADGASLDSLESFEALRARTP